MPIKDTHVQPDRNEDRHEILEHLRKTHHDDKVADSRANPRFNQYIKERRAAHEATKTRD